MRIGNQVAAAKGAARREEPGRKRPAKTVYAGDVQNSLGLRDRIEQKQGMARNRADKIIRDTWRGDKKLDRELEQLDRYTLELRETIRERMVSIHDAAGQKEELRKIYGISDEDMDILNRRGSALLGGEPLTEEEEARYEDIAGQGWYREYRQRVRELDTAVAEEWKAIGQAKRKVYTYGKIAKAIHQERLKVHPMLDAQKKAQEVVDAAVEDVLGMAVDDAKEKMDRQQEEREEEAEVIREEREAWEELRDERGEDDGQDELMDEISRKQQGDGSQAQAGRQLLEIQDKVEMEVQRQVLDIQKQVNSSVEELKSLMVDARL